MSILPVEVCETVIDNIFPDTKTLLECVLVSRHWVPRCRISLYRSVDLKSKRQFTQFLWTISQYPFLGHYARYLSISCDVLGDSELESDPTWMHHVPIRLPSRLPNVVKIEFASLPHLHQTFFILSSGFTQITSLAILFLHHQSFQDLVSLINRFPRLIDLTFYWCEWNASPRRYFPKQHFLKKIDLRCSGQPLVDVLEWILGSKSMTTLEVLGCTVEDDLSMRTLSNLTECSTTLKNLQISFQGGWPENLRGMSVHHQTLFVHISIILLSEFLSLGKISALEQLHISSFPLCLLPSFVHCISHMPCASLHTISMEYSGHRRDTYEKYKSEWTQLDEAFTKGYLKGLTTFDLCPEISDSGSDFDDDDVPNIFHILDNYLPGMRRGGILCCIHNGIPKCKCTSVMLAIEYPF